MITQTIKPMRIVLLSAIVLTAFASCAEGGKSTDQANNKTIAADTTKKSIPSETKASVGEANMQINYHAPGVRGRNIWGGLVPYDEVWVTGAHKATALETDKDLVIGDVDVPAGKYALFTIPGREEWTVIINRNWDQHLADEYDEKDDLLRMKVKPVVREEVQERLKYEIRETGNNEGEIIISWEKLSVPFRVRVKG